LAVTKNSEKSVKMMKEKDKKGIIKNGGPWERPVSSRPKMPRSQRAKQFAPFDALTGLSERLRQAEEKHERELQRK
jgi:hypothetical protein